MLVLLDSNVWLAALARDGVCRRVLELCTAFCTPVVTPFICAEVREKLVTRFHRTHPILGAAVAYHCEFLVTGDDDLLELKSFSGVEIVSVRAFAERLQLKID